MKTEQRRVVDSNYLLQKGFQEVGGAYIMHHPEKLGNWADEIEIIIGDDEISICHYNNCHKDLGYQDSVHNRLREISNDVNTFIKVLEILGIDKEWIDILTKDTIEAEEKEVDIEKEIEERAECVSCCDFCHERDYLERIDWCKEQFRHFYNLGLNSKK